MSIGNTLSRRLDGTPLPDGRGGILRVTQDGKVIFISIGQGTIYRIVPGEDSGNNVEVDDDVEVSIEEEQTGIEIQPGNKEYNLMNKMMQKAKVRPMTKRSMMKVRINTKETWSAVRGLFS
jgi:hypothetical protein